MMNADIMLAMRKARRHQRSGWYPPRQTKPKGSK
ncbi:hypothetical protein SEA_BOMBSHELL_86 [Mycobacterium phage Bombshell]|uniref:Uncharacterized protein n=32 Tax=Backyardiganvirus TaxID=2946815 RepID=A0A7G8LLU0_9CAUD|nr:hypothetical protein PBI_MELVIN_88 [Mycobacterium phage Melvin]ALF01143.1 hypothetical protein SEA_MAVERICK_85 [Mycobacterium phage Maverick]ALH46370.1 hypothetical protein PBI_CAELAKIN_84 [Mycobacterium phage Caelakin]AWN05763.1 hypothetical protein SEA_PIPCRAFT_82 [Mycobacterium phage Pipcraft]QNJ58212.1 hypothetical protein SEA_BOMBSHELL_86 [Mycobacterium phage Bombshell]